MRMNAILAMAMIAVTNVAMAASDGAKNESPQVIKFNYGIPTGAYSALYVAEDLGILKKHGLEPKFFSFQSGAPLLAGLKSGSLDVVTTGLASVFALGQGIPLKYVMWEGDAAQAEALVLQRGTKLSSIKELGTIKTLAAPTGTCAQISLYYATKAAGLEYSKLNVINIAPPLYRNAFTSGSIGAGLAWAPYSLQLKAAGYHLLGFDPDWVPGGGACPEMTIARPAALAKYPELGARLVAAHAEAVKAIEANPQLAVKALAERLHLNMEDAKAVYERYFENYPTLEKQVDPNSRFAMVGDKGLVAQLDLASKTFVELGVIKEAIPMETLRQAVDARYIKAYLESHTKK